MIRPSAVGAAWCDASCDVVLPAGAPASDRGPRGQAPARLVARDWRSPRASRTADRSGARSSMRLELNLGSRRFTSAAACSSTTSATTRTPRAASIPTSRRPASSATRASSSAGSSRRSGHSPGRSGVMYDAANEEMAVPPNGPHGRRAGDLEPLLHRSRQGRVQPQQGDGRLRRLDDGAPAVQRRDHSAARRRHQVARADFPTGTGSGISACSPTCCRRVRPSRATTTSSSLRAGWVPLVSDTTGTLLHVAMNFRAGDVNNDSLSCARSPRRFPRRTSSTPGSSRAVG